MGEGIGSATPSSERDKEEYKNQLLDRAREFIATHQADEITAEDLVLDENFGAVLDQNSISVKSHLLGDKNYRKLTEKGEALANLRLNFFKTIQNEMLRSALTEKFESEKACLLKIIEDTKYEIRANPPMIARDITFSMVTPGGSEAVVSQVDNMFTSLDRLAKILEESDISTTDDVATMLDEITCNIEFVDQALDECYKLDLNFHDVPVHTIASNLRHNAVDVWLNNEKYHQFRVLRPNFTRTRMARYEL